VTAGRPLPCSSGQRRLEAAFGQVPLCAQVLCECTKWRGNCLRRARVVMIKERSRRKQGQ
jgi:hypothetical protein